MDTTLKARNSSYAVSLLVGEWWWGIIREGQRSV